METLLSCLMGLSFAALLFVFALAFGTALTIPTSAPAVPPPPPLPPVPELAKLTCYCTNEKAMRQNLDPFSFDVVS
jgi:hypothetical protein